MFHFFRHTIDSVLTASPAYFNLLQEQFQGDQSSGFICAQVSPELQFVVLFVDGERLFSFRLEPSGSRLLVPGQLEREWFDGDASVRLLKAPSPAVRSVWQTIEWSPPERRSIEARSINGYLQEHRRQKSCGLLYIATQISDGFMALWNGDVHGAETIFDDQRGFEVAFSLERRIQDAQAEIWDIEYYACRSDSLSGKQFILRLALAAWTNRALTHYQNMVGQNLVINANYLFNTQTRKHQLDIRSVGVTLIDRQFFFDLTQLTAAYRLMLPLLLDQMAQVIGAGLTRRIVDGALQALPPVQRQAMEDAGFGEDSSLWKR